jgi:hypothetical protein
MCAATQTEIAASERATWRTAATVIDKHGDLAELHAAQRADALLANGDVDGQRVWKRILTAITAIRRPAPNEGEGVN